MNEIVKRKWHALCCYISFVMKAKWMWLPPKKSQVLIYDRVGSELFVSYIMPKCFAVLDVRRESLNIFILLRALVSSIKGSLFFKYQTLYVQAVQPRVLLTFMDNNENFYHLCGKKELIKIVVQNAYRSFETDTMGLWVQDKNFFDIDYVFVFGAAIGKKYAEHMRGKIVPIGSFRNNFINTVAHNKNAKLSRAILFISQYRIPSSNPDCFAQTSTGEWIRWEDFYQAERILLPFLVQYAFENNLYLCVCGCQGGLLAEAEKKYFETILCGMKWEYLTKIGPYSSYDYVNSAEYVVFIDSTLGYEALANGKRVAAFSIRGNYIPVDDQTFGWPCLPSDPGFFWTNRVDTKRWSDIMNNIVQVSELDWNNLLKAQLDEIITHDPGNTKFVKLLNELGVATNVGDKKLG